MPFVIIEDSNAIYGSDFRELSLPECLLLRPPLAFEHVERNLLKQNRKLQEDSLLDSAKSGMA